MITCCNVSPKQSAIYYQSEDAILRPGQWHGQGATALGLTGVVVTNIFRDVLYGYAPGREFRIRQHQPTHRIKSENGKPQYATQRAATDVTFSPPKSVSIAALVWEDARILQAQDLAVTSVLNTIEQEHIRTRVCIKGIRDKVKTQNITAATFNHWQNRNGDAHLHTHALIMNTTQGPDHKWRSIVNTEFFDHHRMNLAHQYRRELAGYLQELGYPLAWKDEHDLWFEIATVPAELIQCFSTRSTQVNQARKSNSYKDKQRAILTTRKPKPKTNPHRDPNHAAISESIQRLIWEKRAQNATEELQIEQPVGVTSVDQRQAAQTDIELDQREQARLRLVESLRRSRGQGRGR